MKNKRLLKTIVGLAIAFAMTFTPFSGSYAMLVNPAGNGDGQVTETQATDATSEDAVSEETEPSQPEVTTEESEPAEQAEPEIEENVEPVEEVAEKAERTEYIWKDEKVKVTAVLSDAEAIPDDAELVAKAVTSKSDDYDYDAYMEALNKNSDSKYNGKNTLLYDVAFMKDGVEIQPESGTVSVTFEFLDKQLSKSIGAKKASDVNVIHLPLKNKIRDKYDTTADAKNIDAKDIVFEELTKKDNELAVSVKNEKVQFETSEFSVYAYTVDFEYTDPETGKVYTYNLEGAGSITLKELAIILGITTKADADEFVKNVEDVKFSDENLVKVKKTLFRGWVLKSLAPFSSEELLTITMKDGTVIEVRVTDTQESTDLTKFLTNAVITGAALNTGGEYVVEAGKEYNMILSFGEGSTYQFANGEELTYQIPAGIKVLEVQDEPFNIMITYKGRTYQVGATCHLDKNGLLKVQFNKNDPNYPRLVDSTNVSFRFTYHAQFDGTTKKIKFSDLIERDITFDDPDQGKAYAEKTATYDESTGTFHYTITVTATGPVTNVNVKDTVIGDALNVVENSIRISGNSTQPTGGINSTGFEYTFPSMAKDEVITIKYDATVDFSEDEDGDGKITADQTKNTLTVDPEPGDPHNSEYSREINYKYTIKNSGTEAGTTEQGDKIINWEIEYNPLALVAVGGDKITDKISTTSAEYMKYYGNGITVNVYDHSGTLVDTRNVNYNALTYYSNNYPQDGPPKWTYTIPDEDNKPYKYVITYQTVVDMDKVNGGGVPVDLDNTANDSGNSIHVAPKDAIAVDKEVEESSTQKITWNTTLSIPQGGLDRAVVTDYLPRNLEYGFYDSFKADSLEVTGLLDGEDYEYSYNSTARMVTITFYYIQDGVRKEGLKEYAGGRNVNVKLTSTVNQEWLKKGYETGGYVQNHINTIDLNGIQDTAKVVYGKPGINKTVETKDKQSFKYTITIAGLEQEPFIINDTFDTTLLEVDTSQGVDTDKDWYHMHIWGGHQDSQDSGRTPVTYTDTENGINITANTVPKQANGKYYPYYKIIYYLKLKDGVDLEQLAIANGGEYDLINKAIWANHETECKYKVVYDYLDKKLLNEGALGGTNRTAQYQITFNPAKATLNNGEPMEMTDLLNENLSIDYTSIRITTDPKGVEVPYSISRPKDEHGVEVGTTLATFTVPDSTKVTVTYNAEVRGNDKVTIQNRVSILDEDEVEEHTENYGATDEGQGAVASFRILKVDGYDANKKLSGVKFKIFAENPGLDFHDDDPETDPVKELILTTDENGEILLDGHKYRFFFNECYHVQEIEAVEDYEKIGFDYLVTLTNDMAQVDYGHYIYYYSDTMQIKNWPLEGLIVEKQVESDVEKDKTENFEFRVTVLNSDGTTNTNYNGKHGDDVFTNGVTTFLLKDGEHHMLWGFTKGTRYKVEEIDANGFATTVTYKKINEDGTTETVTENSSSHSGTLTEQHETILFKNSKETPEGELEATKTLLNGTLTNEQFEFSMTPDPNNPTEGLADAPAFKLTAKNAANGKVDFGKQKFTKAGVWKYTVKEESASGNGIIKDKSEYEVTYTVTDPDNNGQLKVVRTIRKVKDASGAAVDEAAQAVEVVSFTNKYNAEGEGELDATKTLLNGTLTDEQFEFSMTPAVNNPTEGLGNDPKFKTRAKNNAQGIVNFGKQKFTKAGVWKYTVKEESASGNGITKDKSEYEVTYTVTDPDHNGQLNVVRTIRKVKDASGAAVDEAAQAVEVISFTNKYNAEGEGELDATKTLLNGTLTDEQFEFSMTPASNNPTEGLGNDPKFKTSAKNNAQGIVNFGKQKFTKAGVWKYTVKEESASGNGITKDKSEYEVTYTVTGPDNDGQLNVVRTIRKVKDASGAAVDEAAQTVEVVSFTNKYNAEGEGELDATKTLLNGTLTDEQFEFSMTPAADNPTEGLGNDPKFKTSAKNNAQGKVNFGKQKFTKAGVWKYTVKEESASGNGITKDKSEYEVTYTVTDPDHNGQLKVVRTIRKVKDASGAAVDEAAQAVEVISFTNKYNAEGEGELDATKTLLNGTLTDEQFEFSMTPAANNPTEGLADAPAFKLTAKNAANGKVDFGKQKFTKAGVWKYTVKEESASGNGITKDKSEYEVTYTVTDPDNNGQLKVVRTIRKVKDASGAAVDEAAQAVEVVSFTNKYNAEGEGELDATKTLLNGTLTDEQFEFSMTPAANNPTEGLDTQTKFSTSAKNDANGKVDFGKQKFTKEGVWKYTVKEESASGSGITKDLSEYEVTYTVTDPDHIGKLKVVRTIRKVKDASGAAVDEAAQAVEVISFTNIYDAKGSIPLKGTKEFKFGSFDKAKTNGAEFTFSVYTKGDFDYAVDHGLFTRERDRNDQEFINDLQGKAVLTASTTGAQLDSGNAVFNFKTADGKDLEYTLADIKGGEIVDGHLTKDFDYVVVEDIPKTAVKKTVGDSTFYYDSTSNIKYDARVYHVTITVTDNGDGTLDVRTKAGDEGPLTFEFKNEKVYTKLLLTKNIDSLVTGDTQGELTNVTCVFKVSYTDPILGRAVSRTVSVQFDATKVSAETAWVDKIPIDATDLRVDEVYAVDYRGITDGVALGEIDQDTGLRIWTVEFDNTRNGDRTGSGVINSVKKNGDGFVITNRRDSTGKNPSPPGNADDNQAPQDGN